jgi:hypothetical protein
MQQKKYRKPVQFEKNQQIFLNSQSVWEEWTELISTVDVTDLQGGPTNDRKIILLADGSFSCEQLHPVLIR